MNRINPLYISAFLVVILLVIWYQDHKIQRLVGEKSKHLYQLEKVGKKVAVLRNYWGDSKLQQQRVLQLVNSPLIKPFVKKSRKGRERYKIVIEGIDASNADRIADKIFNSFVKVGAFSITRKDKTKISMEVEFRY
ncbi:hypothetical protein NitYY0826_P07 (plasmid) [Nitratiruptor sp. YY08-26]|uniref:hypothetical protein n=1 Tax=unclassified Nitratiruptor TaxID=2624044 RepID=UPI0018EB5D0A|nr:MULTISPECIES: hypothetical protein [unclassified Nitratiruptor]BCD63166.1 hypothetical protein NitYY0813_P07 [Nitratiruptor sp. YY08-13]BCD67102.1 hypothetical protein NitYY0826_P07 [Nitratiruptor sp. YY08-26]